MPVAGSVKADDWDAVAVDSPGEAGERGRRRRAAARCTKP